MSLLISYREKIRWNQKWFTKFEVESNNQNKFFEQAYNFSDTTGNSWENAFTPNKIETVKYNNKTIQLWQIAWLYLINISNLENEQEIIDALQKFGTRFSYLKDSSYISDKKVDIVQRQIWKWKRKKTIQVEQIKQLREWRWFNITNDQILDFKKAWRKRLPIPLEHPHKQIDDKQFANYCYDAIKELESNEIIWEQMKRLVNRHWYEKLICFMMAFARSETGSVCYDGNNNLIEQNIWTFELQRYETNDNYNCFSIWYYHILLANNSAWLKAQKALNLKSGQLYHPKNSWKLFRLYRYYKTKEPLSELDINDLDRLGKIFNGNAEYAVWLKENYRYVWRKLFE